MDTCPPGGLQIADGTYYDLVNFDPADVPVEMVAHQLALKCRWNGNTNDLSEECEPVFFSVAQHACNVHDMALNEKERFVPGYDWKQEPCPSAYALHHDSSEGPLFDIARPLKQLEEFAPLVALENMIQSKLQRAYGINPSPIQLECVRRIDMAMLFLERDALMGKPVTPYAHEFDHPGGSIYDLIPDFEPWSPARAKREFLNRHYNLRERGLVV